jgi:ankyrin repeat protein
MDKYDANALLFEAAENGDVSKVQAALDAGANINTHGNLLESPLHDAALNGHTKVVQLLIARGANVNAMDVFDKTPKDWAFAKGHFKIVQLLEDLGKHQGHADRVTGERKDKGPPQVGG